MSDRPRDIAVAAGGDSTEPAPEGETVLVLGDALAAVFASAATLPRDARDTRTATILRRHTGRHDIAIARRPSGRPRLAAPYPELAVSIADSGCLTLAAFSPTRRVGADIEIADAAVDAVTLARDHFTPAEAAAVAAMPAPEPARDLFYRLWVAKEAALKLTGRGIFDGLAEPDLAPRLADIQRDGVVIDLPLTSRLPALALVVRRLHQLGPSAAYCALAVET